MLHEVACAEAIARVAGLAPEPSTRLKRDQHRQFSQGRRLTMEDYLSDKGISFECTNDKPGYTKYLIDSCVFNPEHHRPDCYFFQHTSGAVGYKCSHDSCRSNRWQQVKDLLGAPEPRHWVGPDGSDSDSAGAQPRSFGGVPVCDIWDLANESVDWLVQDVFSADQPTIFGAKQKSLKTTLLADLAVCLATGFPWLNRFDIPAPRRVLVITGEASQRAAVKKIRKAAEFRNLRGESLSDQIRIEAVSFPTLPRLEDCMAVQQAVIEHQIEVVILDPLYMGLEGLNTANLTEVGPAMRRFMEHCQPASVIIAHHVKKTASYDDAPNLEDLSQAGIAEFAGNYWLMGRMSEYQGDGRHQLAIRYGVRDEQFGLLKLDFDERQWTADFQSLLDHREFQKQSKENQKVATMNQKIRRALQREPDGMTTNKLASACGTKPERDVFSTSIEEMSDSGELEYLSEVKSGRRLAPGYRLRSALNKDTLIETVSGQTHSVPIPNADAHPL